MPVRLGRDFTKLWAASAVSHFGTEMSLVAFPLVLLICGGSPADAGMLALVQGTVIFIGTIPLGYLVDLASKRHVMVVSDVGRCSLMLVCGLLVWQDAVTVELLWVLGGLAALLATPYDAASSSAIKAVVAPEYLSRAFARDQVRSETVSTLGPPVAGRVFHFFPPLNFLLDALSFAVSAFLVARVRDAAPRHRPEGNPVRECFDGLRWSLSRSPVLVLLIVGVLLNTSVAGLDLLVVLRFGEGGERGDIVGVVLGMLSAGAVLGALATESLMARLRGDVLFLISLGSYSVALGLSALTDRPLMFGVLLALAMFWTPANGALFFSAVMTAVPSHLTGRVSSSLVLVLAGFSPFGAAAVGFAYSSLGQVQVTLVLAAIVLPGALLIAFCRPFASLVDGQPA